MIINWECFYRMNGTISETWFWWWRNYGNKPSGFLWSVENAIRRGLR